MQSRPSGNDPSRAKVVIIHHGRPIFVARVFRTIEFCRITSSGGRIKSQIFFGILIKFLEANCVWAHEFG